MKAIKFIYDEDTLYAVCMISLFICHGALHMLLRVIFRLTTGITFGVGVDIKNNSLKTNYLTLFV